MSARVRVNGHPGMHVDAADRGLAYGDGLFETIWLDGGRAPLWPRHMTRLRDGCRRLGMPEPDPERLWHEVRVASAGLAFAVVRITWTRGCGPRGYAPPTTMNPTCIVSAAPSTPWPADWYHHGIRMHLCRTRLAVQPALAGLKHLNRLEQVLARREWSDPQVGEGLMLDTEQRVISATAANVFALCGQRLYTPPVDRSGVAGTARAELLARHPDTVVAELSLETLLDADAVFVTSAVRGIVPVHELDGHAWTASTRVRDMQQAWHASGMPPGVVA
ncbi:MAG TPA: aminodeoxychorismate lyase [Oleiagrimonas sp.]|nr:aminodeoxychorismate lyase [Oleiagrimonas sp.]